MAKEKRKGLIGQEFEFNQYMCSKCRRMFFIQSDNPVGLEIEGGKFKEFRSPCCGPYQSGYPPGTTKDPHGIYIRHIKLKVVDIPDEIALVHRRRVAAESGKVAYPDPKDEEDE